MHASHYHSLIAHIHTFHTFPSHTNHPQMVNQTLGELLNMFINYTEENLSKTRSPFWHCNPISLVSLNNNAHKWHDSIFMISGFLVWEAFGIGQDIVHLEPSFWTTVLIIFYFQWKKKQTNVNNYYLKQLTAKWKCSFYIWYDSKKLR